MMIECEMSEKDEKILFILLIDDNQRMLIFRIISINHEFFMNSIMINQITRNDNN